MSVLVYTDIPSTKFPIKGNISQLTIDLIPVKAIIIDLTNKVQDAKNAFIIPTGQANHTQISFLNYLAIPTLPKSPKPIKQPSSSLHSIPTTAVLLNNNGGGGGGRGGNTYYVTPASSPNLFPTSLLEMGLQNQALSFKAIVEGRQVMIVVRNSTFLSHVVSQGMRLGLETYNNHMWMSSIFQNSMIPPSPQMSFFRFPT